MAKRPRLAAAAIAPIAAAAASAAAIVLHVVAPPHGPHLRFADLVAGTSFALAGVLVLRREPRNTAGRLLLSVAALAFDPLLNEIAWRSPHDIIGDASLWVANWIWVLYLLLPTLLVLLLPGGRLPSRSWRPVAVGICALTVVAAIAAMLRPGGSDQIASLDNPLGIGRATFLVPTMAVAVGLVFGVGGAACVAGLLVRQRRAEGVECAQLRWLTAGAAAAATAFAGSIAAPWPLGEAFLAAGLAALPTAIVIAMWRHRLYDADVVLNRAAASFVLTAAGLAAYALAVALSDRAAPAAAAVIALVAAAGWGRGQRLTRRLLYGVRDDPLAVLERVGSRIDALGAPSQALQALVETIRDALRLPYVAVTGGEDVDASAGSPVARVSEFACTAGGQRIANLVVGHRHAGEQWRDDERTLLEDSARRAAALVQTGRLVADLERSRNSLVGAREEERRRLRRDLHDGVASALAGISLQLDCVDEGSAESRFDAIAQIRKSTRVVTSEVRALVHDLRPPSLDELGLAAAVREHAAVWSGTMSVDIGSTPLPPLPAATEVAAYRIATEAIANAARHGAAHACCVRLIPAHPWLHLEVEDNGSGFVEPSRGGVGLDAMRARAAEVGGTVEVVSEVGHGTTVRARLPLEIV